MYQFASVHCQGERQCDRELGLQRYLRNHVPCENILRWQSLSRRVMFQFCTSPAPHLVPSSLSQSVVHTSLIREPVHGIQLFHRYHSRDMMNPAVIYCTWQQPPQLWGTYASNLRISQIDIYMGIFVEISEASWYLTQKQTHLELKHFPLGSLAAVYEADSLCSTDTFRLNAALYSSKDGNNKDVCQRKNCSERFHVEHLYSAVHCLQEFIDHNFDAYRF